MYAGFCEIKNIPHMYKICFIQTLFQYYFPLCKMAKNTKKQKKETQRFLFLIKCDINVVQEILLKFQNEGITSGVLVSI